MFKGLVILLILLTAPDGVSQTVHLIIAADVEDSEYGMASIKDEETISKTFAVVKEKLDYDLKTTYLEKNKFKASEIKRVFTNLNTKPKDLVVFYYSGLGYYPKEIPNLAYPFLKLKKWQNNPLSLEQIAQLINAKTNVYGLAIADCRDAFPPEISRDLLLPLIVKEEWEDKVIMRKLFMESCNVKILCSSSKGQKTFTTVGGLSSSFTSRFSNSFNHIINSMSVYELPKISFENLIQNAEMENLAGPFYHDPKTQTAIWKTFACNSIRRSLNTKFPSYDNTLNYSGLSDNLNSLTIESSIPKRERLLNKMKLGFVPNAEIKVERFKQGKRTPDKKLTTSLSEYFEMLQKGDPKLLGIELISDKIIRTPDYTKITSLTVQEMWE